MAGESWCTVQKISADLWRGDEQLSCAFVAVLVALRAVTAAPSIACPHVAHHQGCRGSSMCVGQFSAQHCKPRQTQVAAMQLPDGHSREAARREGTQFQITSFLKPKRSSSEL